jgi:hypothetical protein
VQEQVITDGAFNEKHVDLEATAETKFETAPDTDIETASEVDAPQPERSLLARVFLFLQELLMLAGLAVGAAIHAIIIAPAVTALVSPFFSAPQRAQTSTVLTYLILPTPTALNWHARV